jgi:RNA polymerase sigma factor (sigma-70 family)
MPQCVLSATVSRVRAVAAPAPDAALVSAFAGGDPEAFAEIVRRHGAMVLGVCRKITRHAHDAEDAAQAAFLVLARRAGTIRAAGLASWLFGVAVNTSREVRRRSSRHATTGVVPEVGRCDPDRDFDTPVIVAEELARLPDRYRELVVRCDLEGESQAAVARRTGLPVGTVYSRLSAARSLLAGGWRGAGSRRAWWPCSRSHAPRHSRSPTVPLLASRN